MFNSKWDILRSIFYYHYNMTQFHANVCHYINRKFSIRILTSRCIDWRKAKPATDRLSVFYHLLLAWNVLL